MFLQSQLARARRQTFAFEPEASAKFASPEDTVLSKLQSTAQITEPKSCYFRVLRIRQIRLFMQEAVEWYRLGGELSERQWRDILGVLKTRLGELDLEYLRQWAKELHLTRLFERAIQESA